VPIQARTVSFRGVSGTTHSVDVEAETLYAAVVLAVQRFRKDIWGEAIGNGTPLEVEIREAPTKHPLTLGQVERWLASPGTLLETSRKAAVGSKPMSAGLILRSLPTTRISCTARRIVKHKLGNVASLPLERATRMKNRSSKSAAGVALIRAIETEKPESERICFDPYARTFATQGILAALAKPLIKSKFYERLSQGAMAFIVVRERYIDDCLAKALGDRLEQVVILGAGFDTRAYRVPGIEKTRVFEIDHPATQAEKAAKLKSLADPLPSHVTMLPVDFDTQALDQQLLTIGHGYDERAKTFFIWQGVTYFLTAAGVDKTLAFIAQHSGAGSAVIFDYFHNEKLRDEAKALARAAKVSGEPYVFGIDRGTVESFLIQRGFRDVHDATLEDLKQRYFTGPNAARVVPSGIGIVYATVSANNESKHRTT
jgi:methyltransferase (TIGR00027 family)